MGVLSIEEQGNKVYRVKDGLQSVTIDLHSSPMWLVELTIWTVSADTRRRVNVMADLHVSIQCVYVYRYGI